MHRLLPAVMLLLATIASADTYTPPVLLGVKGNGSGHRSQSPIPFPAENESWVHVETPHFSVLSSRDESRTRTIAQNLEALAAALGKLDPAFASERATPTRVIVFSRHNEAQPYFQLLTNRGDAHVAGLFVAQKDGGTMLIDDSRDWRADRTPYHELVHDLLAKSDAHLPLWLEEGLAEYFSNTDVFRDALRAGMPVREHIDVLKRRSLIPATQLFAIVRENDVYNVPSGQSLFYAESWAAVDWMLRTNRDAFYAFLRDVQSGTTAEAALRTRFGRTTDDLQRAIASYTTYTPGPFGVSLPLPRERASITSSAVDRAEVLYQLGMFLSKVDDERADAERHFHEAIRIDAKHARAMAALGMFDEAVAAAPHDTEVLLLYAESLLGKAIGPLAETEPIADDAAPRFRKARALVEQAITLGATTGRAFGDLGTTYLVERELTPGIAALEKASPERIDFALHLFAMYRTSRELDKADALFARLEAARDPQVAYAARAVVVRIELDRANALVQSQQLAEAAGVIRGLAAITKDADAKHDLERQAAGIDAVAEQNRQISAYNEAVGQVNAGNYAVAKKTLATLLASATDAGVIRDAKKLQAELTKRK